MSSIDIVSGWLSGADSAGGHENPAGPLYIHGEAATRNGMTAAFEKAASSTLMTCCSATVNCC
jgi:hypothetical protein